METAYNNCLYMKSAYTISCKLSRLSKQKLYLLIVIRWVKPTNWRQHQGPNYLKEKNIWWSN